MALRYSVCGGDVLKQDLEAVREVTTKEVEECDELMESVRRRVEESTLKGDLGDRGSTLNKKERDEWYKKGVQVRKTAVQDEATAVILERLRDDSRVNVEMACGTGKTRLAVRVVEALVKDRLPSTEGDGLNITYVVVLVPTLALIPQTIDEWYDRCNRDACPFMCEVTSVCSLPKLSSREANDNVSEESEDEIKDQLKEKNWPKGWNEVVDDFDSLGVWLRRPQRDKSPDKPLVRLTVSTYHSVSKVSTAFHKNSKDVKLALTIFDEAHVTCVNNSASKSSLNRSSEVDFTLALKDTEVEGNTLSGMTSMRRLFMTATRRVPKGSKVHSSMDGVDAPEEMVTNMDDEKTYGKCAFRLPMERAIELGLIRDYVVYGVGYRPEKGHEATTEVRDAEQEERRAHVNFTKKLLALAAAMIDEQAHKGFVFMSKIKAVDAAKDKAQELAGKMQDMHGKHAWTPKPLFVKNHSNQQTQTRSEREEDFKKFESATNESHRFVLMFNVRSLGVGVNVPDARAAAILSGMATPEGLTQAIGRVLRHDKKDPRPGAHAILLLPYEVISDGTCDERDDFGDEKGRPRASSSKAPKDTAAAKPRAKRAQRSDADAKTMCNVLSALSAADSRVRDALRTLKRGQNMYLQDGDERLRMSAMADLDKYLKFKPAEGSEQVADEVLRLRNQVYAAQLPLVALQVPFMDALEELEKYLEKKRITAEKEQKRLRRKFPEPVYFEQNETINYKTRWGQLDWKCGKWYANILNARVHRKQRCF